MDGDTKLVDSETISQLNKVTEVTTDDTSDYGYIESKVQPDTLFTFVSKLEYLIEHITTKNIPPRYCIEDISYLNIPKIKKLAYPMKCFCNINLQKLPLHMDTYGYYGLAFEKSWGVENGLQPVHYINPTSKLCVDIREAFSNSLDSDKTYVEENSLEEILKNYLLHELMYYKPYAAHTSDNSPSEEKKGRCFTDECEWRYIPIVDTNDLDQVIYDKDLLRPPVLNNLNNLLKNKHDIALSFDYDNLKYIIVKFRSDRDTLIKKIEGLNLETNEMYNLISKIMVWESFNGDF